MAYTLVEHPDINALKAIIKLPFINKEDKPRLQRYLELAEEGSGEVEVQYTQTLYNGEDRKSTRLNSSH